MAALCGPSNALTNLQKHATADRSFHQDRLRAGPSSAGPGFRSSTPGTSGWVENDFDAFASGAPLAAESLNAQPQHSWANDFQRLAITPQQPQQRFTPPPPMQMQQPQPAWGLEFMQRLQQRPAEASATVVPQESYAPTSSSYMAMGSPVYSPSVGLGMTEMGMAQAHLPVQSTAEEFQFSASAFEQAFAEAEREVLGEKPAFDVPESWVAEPPVEKEKEKEPSSQDGDALAKTAGLLLDSVQENRSVKFQNSNFLALMRKLRDHEVVVEGDQMVETHS